MLDTYVTSDLTSLLKNIICDAVADEISKNANTNLNLTYELGPAKFYTIDDVVSLTGISKKQVRKIFNDPDFPCCLLGKSYIVEEAALRKYFSVRRSRDDSPYWRAFN